MRPVRVGPLLVCALVMLRAHTVRAQAAKFSGSFFQHAAGFVNDAEIRNSGSLEIKLDLFGCVLP